MNPAQPVEAGLQEIFSSIQGEGPLVGKRQIFVRFNACHLHCQYCDTPQRAPSKQCEVEKISGSGEKLYLDNPLTPETVFAQVQELHNQAKHHSISFTGGEPLLYTSFLKVLLPWITLLLPVYLETSGTQPDKLEAILPWVQYIAMDIKLPSATGEPMQLENHQAFYRISRQKEMFIKLVFSEHTSLEEIAMAQDIVTDRSTPIILQPVTDLITGENTVSALKIFELEAFLSQWFEDVRVIPQTHKMLSLL